MNKKKSDEQVQELMVADSIRQQSGFDILRTVAMTELLTIFGQAFGLRRYFSPECFLNLQKVPKLRLNCISNQ